MKVEQQNASVLDQIKQGGTEEKKGIAALGSPLFEDAVDKAREKDGKGLRSINVKDATYGKPGASGEDEKKTLAEEMEESSAMSAKDRKEQMVVLAGTTSEEDYERMSEDGFKLNDTAGGTIVTEVDKIKATLAKAGVDISGFGGDLDVEELAAITGSPELAAQIIRDFKREDVPLTEESAREAVEAMQLAQSLERPDLGAMAYLVQNALPPTIENLYKAEHVGGQDAPGEGVDIAPFIGQVDSIIARAGYGAITEARDAAKWLLSSEIPLTEENLKYAMRLREMEVPQDSAFLSREVALAVASGQKPRDAMLLEGYDLLSRAESAAAAVAGATDEDLAYIIDNKMDFTVQSITYAIAMRDAAGRGASGANGISDAQDFASSAESGAGGLSAAAAVSGAAETLGAQGASDAQDAGGLFASDAAPAAPVSGADGAGAAAGDGSLLGGGDQSREGDYTPRGLALIRARRQLEEARLAMSVQANYSLLKRGVRIETESLEKLVSDLRASEDSYYERLLKSEGVDATEENVARFKGTAEAIEELKGMPAYLLGTRGIRTATLGEAHAAGAAMQERLEEANERYEALMTAPRADLGDSIQKAFQNVDDILRDLGIEETAANERAVRILAYNQTAITPEAIAQVKATDEEVQRAFHNLTPKAVLEMIREGVNPLDMGFEDLNHTAEQFERESGGDRQESWQFAEFLWKLEQNKGISESERSAYIGIYRLIHQVESTDGAAIGALIRQGTDVTMRNLMMAVRSERRSGKMEYSVDDGFGGSEPREGQAMSIIEQIEAGYQANCVKDAADMLTPARLKKFFQEAGEWDEMTPEQLKEALASADAGEEEAAEARAYAREQLSQLEQCAGAREDVYRVLEQYDIPNTTSNILAVQEMMQNRNGAFRRIFGDVSKNVSDDPDASDIENIKKELLERFGEAVKSPREMGEAQEALGKLAENVMRTMIDSDEPTSLDIREMRLLSAQLDVQKSLAKKEQYAVPVLVEGGVVNVSLKIVRGVGRRGFVDIMLEDRLRGKIAATFQARDGGISGLVASDNDETRELLEKNQDLLLESIGEEGGADISFACIEDLDLARFSSGLLGENASRLQNAQGAQGAQNVSLEKEAESEESAESEGYRVQTTRLYRIAEGFIRQIRETL